MANDCLWRDVTRLYKDRPVASVKKQIIGIFAVLILAFLTYAVQDRLAPKNVLQKLKRDDLQEYKDFRSSGMSPNEMRKYMCFDNTAMLGDVFQEVIFRLLAMKWLIVEININPHVANLIQAAIFGFMHCGGVILQEKSRTLSMYHSIISAFYGIYVGYLFIHTNSIFPCIITHILYNQTNCLTEVSDYAKFLKK